MTITTQPSGTSTKIWPSDDEVNARYPVFTRANTGEVFTDASSPFTWSLLGRVVYEGGYRDALFRIGAFAPSDFGPLETGKCTCVASFGSYVYINLSMSRVLGVRAPGMTTQAIDQSFFGEHPDVPDYVEHPDDVDEERSADIGAWMGAIFAPAPDPNEAHARDIDALLAAAPDFTALSDGELVAYARRVVDELRPVFATHMFNLYSANIATGVVAQAAGAAGLGHLTSAIFAGLGGVDSAQQSFDIWGISRIVRRSPELTAAFDAGLDGVLERIAGSSSTDAAAFREAWDRFIGDWGFLGPSVWELRSPTYASQPRIVLHMIDGSRRAEDDASPEKRTSSFAAERQNAVAAVAAALEGTEAHGMFVAAAGVIPALLPAREGSKVQCTRLVNHVRDVMKELGRRHVEAGRLSHWSDILMLQDSEIDGYLDAPESWGRTIAERRATLTELESKVPPFIVDGRYPDLEDFRVPEREVTRAAVGDVLQGIGVAPGSHTGRVQVVTSIEDDVDIEPGDVLVARTTDSSWGALFLVAGAVVVETGATISHAAIVSRELGIPAAASVPDALSRLATGMLVSVDGSTGEVRVVSE